MIRAILAAVSVLFVVAACTPPTDPNQQEVFKIRKGDTSKIQLRMLDAVNALRQSNGLNQVQLSSQLNASAKTHAIDISKQNRPWHFGSDGSSPLTRAARAGYSGNLVGENVSESFENDTETLQAWMRDPVTRSVILHPEAQYMGFGWYQESYGKIWWVQDFGS